MITPSRLLRMTALCVVAYAVVLNVRTVVALPSLEVNLSGSGAMALMAWLTPFVLVAVLALTHPTTVTLPKDGTTTIALSPVRRRDVLASVAPTPSDAKRS